MTRAVGNGRPGVRDRKKLRTRGTLVHAAMELCLKQGYEQTTVDQIAAAADVSPRTFSRYFATKDAVFMTLIVDYVEEVVRELEAVPSGVGPLEAMRSAHVAVLTKVAMRPFAGRVTSDRIVLMLRVINASDVLRQAAFDFEHEPLQVLLAKRMGMQVGDRKVRLLSAVFAATIVTACGDLVADVDGVALGPNVMIERINEAFAHVSEFAADLSPRVNPPQA